MPMTKRDEYHGWSNRATWTIALWIDNEEGSQRYWQERAEEMLETHGRETAIYRLSDSMKDEFKEQASEQIPSGLWTDMIGLALADVDWDEVAKSRIDPLIPKRPEPRPRRAREEPDGEPETKNIYWRDIPVGAKVELVGHSYYATPGRGKRMSVYWMGNDSVEAQRRLDDWVRRGERPPYRKGRFVPGRR